MEVMAAGVAGAGTVPAKSQPESVTAPTAARRVSLCIG